MRYLAWDRDGSQRRAAIYADRLDVLRFQAFITRCQIAKAHDEDMRALLATRLDVVDARAADFFARLTEVAA